MDQSADDVDSEDAPAPPKQNTKRTKASKPSATPNASTMKPLDTAPPEASVQSEDMSRVSKKAEKTMKAKKPKKIFGHELTPAAVLCNEDDTIDLSSNEDLGDDSLEMLIKSNREVEIFNDLPLFDVDILNTFIDEWFDNQELSFDDLQLPIGISISFQGIIAPELA